MNAKIWGRWVSRLFSQRKSARQQPANRRRLAFEPLEDRVTPATFIWTGGGTNSNWSTGANWQGGVAPTSLANPDLVFSLALTPISERTTTNDLTNLTVKAITISAPNYTLNGNKVLLDGSVTVGVGATAARMNLDVQLTAVSTFTVNNNADLIVNGHMSGSATMTKRGVGPMTLSNDNIAYTGAIDVQTGRLIMSHVNALGTTATPTTVEANAQLQIRNVPTLINETLILNGPGPTNDGALLNFSGNSTWGGSITMDSDSSFGVASTISGPNTVHHTLTISGVISDSGFTGGHNLTKAGTGTLVFSRVGGNTYRGQTVVNNGILRIQDPLSLGAGATAGTPQSGSPQSGTIVEFNSTTGVAGTLQLNFVGLPNNDPNAVLQNPNLPFNPVTNPIVGLQVFNDLLTLNGPGFSGLGALHNLAGNNIWNGGVTLGSPLPNTSDIDIGVAEDTRLIISGVVGDDPNRTGADIPDLFKILPGRLVFDNANTYRGNTIVETGVLTIRDSRGFAAAPGAGMTSVIPIRTSNAPRRLNTRWIKVSMGRCFALTTGISALTRCAAAGRGRKSLCRERVGLSRSALRESVPRRWRSTFRPRAAAGRPRAFRMPLKRSLRSVRATSSSPKTGRSIASRSPARSRGPLCRSSRSAARPVRSSTTRTVSPSRKIYSSTGSASMTPGRCGALAV